MGHIITAEGLKPNPCITDAVQNFPTPENVQSVRRFLGMASYYRRFIAGFAKIAQPLHHLTAKDVPFQWSPECEAAVATLKNRLVSPPVLAYPCFGGGFTLETDASIRGLGAILSQKQPDKRLHPVAYASRALNPTEKNYSVTELETLAVVWAITHFHSYLYGGDVTVITGHSAVKQVLSPHTLLESTHGGGNVYMEEGSGLLILSIGLDEKMPAQMPSPGVQFLFLHHVGRDRTKYKSFPSPLLFQRIQQPPLSRVQISLLCCSCHQSRNLPRLLCLLTMVRNRLKIQT